MKFSKKKLTEKQKQELEKAKQKLIDDSMTRLNYLARVNSKKKQSTNKLSLQRVLEIVKDDIHILEYKKYKSSKEKQEVIKRVFIYYIEYEEFKKYCKENGLSQYLERFKSYERNFF